MRIAVWYNLPSGGGKRALYYHVRGLVQRGHTVEAWCPSTAERSYLPLSDLVSEHVLPLELRSASDNTISSKLERLFYGVGYNIKAMNRHCRTCAEQINRGGFDLFFTYSSQFIAPPPIGRYITIPRVLYLNEPTRQLYEALPRLHWIPLQRQKGWFLKPDRVIEQIENGLKKKYFRILAQEESLNIEAYTMVLANSLYSRESILRAYGVNAGVCYLGVDTELFKDTHRQRENYAVGIGSFNPSKNIEFVIRALGRVKGVRPRLLWIGNYSVPRYLHELKRLAQDLHVDFQPRELVTDGELVDILNRASMMVYAPRLEPFGFAPLEANACGLPVVAVAEGGVRETVTDGVNGLLADPEEKPLAAAVERLVNDGEYAARLGRNGLKMVAEKWSLQAAVDRLEQRFTEVLSNVKRIETVPVGRSESTIS